MTALQALRQLWAQPPWLEIAANFVNLGSILLATRNSVHTWWTGLLGCALFAVMFYQAQLLADVALQGFFVVTSLIGWWHWRHRGGRVENRPITSLRARHCAWLLPVAALATLGYGSVLRHFTGAYAPYVDSAVLALSVIAQCLLMARKRETWIFWFVVNSVAVPLYASRDLWLTAGFYLLFWFNAPVGYWQWRREQRAQDLAAPSARSLARVA
jgi:nicotinamide mononucleotide transporter